MGNKPAKAHGASSHDSKQQAPNIDNASNVKYNSSNKNSDNKTEDCKEEKKDTYELTALVTYELYIPTITTKLQGFIDLINIPKITNKHTFKWLFEYAFNEIISKLNVRRSRACPEWYIKSIYQYKTIVSLPTIFNYNENEILSKKNVPIGLLIKVEPKTTIFSTIESNKSCNFKIYYTIYGNIACPSVKLFFDCLNCINIRIENIKPENTMGWFLNICKKEIKLNEKSKVNWHVWKVCDWTNDGNSITEYKYQDNDSIFKLNNNIKGALLLIVEADIFDSNHNNIITCENLNENDKNYLYSIDNSNCQNGKKINQFIASKCRIFDLVYNWHQFEHSYLLHLQSCNHWPDTSLREVCEYGINCYSFARIVDTNNELKYSDRADIDKCHMQVYRHPPRDFSEIIGGNNNDMHEFKFTLSYDGLSQLAQVNEDEKMSDLELLKNEIGENDKNNCEWLKKISQAPTDIDTLMNHEIHKDIGKPLSKAELLAIYIYCSIGCINAEMCKCQRNGDFKTWKYLDYFLFNGIYKLWMRQRGTLQKLFSGVSNVTMNLKEFEASHKQSEWKEFYEDNNNNNNNNNNNKKWFYMYPQTYISSTYDRQVADMYTGNNGILLEFDEILRNCLICADVSWISEFGDESEILIARGIKSSIGTNQFASQYMAGYISDLNGSTQYVKCCDVIFMDSDNNDEKDFQSILRTSRHGQLTDAHIFDNILAKLVFHTKKKQKEEY